MIFNKQFILKTVTEERERRRENDVQNVCVYMSKVQLNNKTSFRFFGFGQIMLLLHFYLKKYVIYCV